MRAQKPLQYPVRVMYGLQCSPCDLFALLPSEEWSFDQRTLPGLLKTALTLRCALCTAVMPAFTGKKTRSKISLDIQIRRKQVRLADHN